jgi:putative ABC transport system permease protein
MLGMIIGVGAVVLLVSIGNGAKNYITSQFEGLGTNLIMIQPGRTDQRSGGGPPMGNSKNKLTMRDITVLEEQAFSVDAITGVMFGSGAIKSEFGVVNCGILGTNENFVRIFNVRIQLGNYISREEDNSGRRVVVFGSNVARHLFPEQNPIGKSVRVNDSEFRVSGVLAEMGNKLGFNMDEMVFIPTRSAMRLFNDEKLVGIRGRAKARISVDDAVEEVREILKRRHNGEEDFTIVTQVSMLSTMNTILGMLTYVLGGIAMISMIVGGIGIMNIMLVSVTERTREIGVRRAVGARQVDIMMQFLSEALTLSLTGGLIGILGAMVITYLAYAVYPDFDMRPPFWVLLPAFLMSVSTGVVFGVWPARKASHIETIDALRYE